MKLARITITMDTLNREKMELIEKIAGRMKWTKEQYHVIDYAESFYSVSYTHLFHWQWFWSALR